LKREDMLAAMGGKGRAVDRVLAEIERSRRVELWRFIRGLGIPQVGVAAARDLAWHCRNLAALAELGRSAAGKDEVIAIPGVGAVAARGARTYFRQGKNQALVAELIALGVHPASPQE